MRAKEFLTEELATYNVIYSLPDEIGKRRRNAFVKANSEEEAMAAIKERYGGEVYRAAKIGNLMMGEGEDPNIIAIYNNPEISYDDGGTVKIYKNAEGFYGDTNEFDFVRPDLESLKATLKKWGYTNLVYGKDLLAEGDVVDTKFMQKLGQKRGMMHNPDAEPPVSRVDGKPFDRFEVREHPSGKVGTIIGVRSDGYREDISAAQLELAHALTGAYNAGGYSAQSIKKVSLKDLFKEDELGVPTPSPEEVAKKHGVPLEKILRQLIMGIEVEQEHVMDASLAKEIALDHLGELPDYYTRLNRMERE